MRLITKEVKNLALRFGMMKQRCYNKKNPAFKYYGSRGITVCEEWKHNQQAFVAWALENGYSKHLTIDRIDNDKGYSPDNCRFVDQSTQMRNRRHADNSTGYRGVSASDRINVPGGKIYRARIVPKYPDMSKVDKRISLGWFGTAKGAAMAYDKYIKKFNLSNISNGLLND